MNGGVDGSRAVDTDAVALALGDHSAIALVLAWGMVDHNGIEGLLDLRQLVGTLAPFLAGFLLTALLAGIYGRNRWSALPSSLRTVAAAWFGGAGIGLVARTSPIVEGGATWPFGLVAIGSVLLGLVAWRVAAYALLRRRSEVDQPA